jgi:4-hydroxy-tetrahydrodipicolinate synthase
MNGTALPTGIVTPLVAFLTEAGRPDVPAMTALVDHQISGGVAAVLVNGSMGELGNLTPDQRHAMLETVAGAAAGRIPVWSGIAGLSTGEAVAAAKRAAAAGADALLVLPPLYFDYSDAELARHFGAVAAAVPVPVLAYDIPQRSPRKLPLTLVAELAAAGVLAGVKDSSADLTAARQLCFRTDGIPGFKPYIGTEVAIDAAVTLGFAGSVPGLANILPDVGVAIDAAARSGDFTAAARAQRIYVGLMELLAIPLASGSGLSVSTNAFKAAAGRIIGLGPFHPVPPVTAPDATFLDAVAGVLDPLAASWHDSHPPVAADRTAVSVTANAASPSASETSGSAVLSATDSR